MTQFYDPEKKCIVYLGNKSDKSFWDRMWKRDGLPEAVRASRNTFVSDITKEFLQPPAEVLEGGSGQGLHVHALQYNGFSTTGVDYAEETVNELARCVPELRVVHADIRCLPFKDLTFDAYWSLGVIEHFWGGYDDVIYEMKRVVRDGGFAFVTFPCISTLRRYKIKTNRYEVRTFGRAEPEDFYQFALDPLTVIQSFNRHGFKCQEVRYMDPLKGLKDDLLAYRPLIRWVYKGHSFWSRVIRFLLSNTLPARTLGHSVLLVLKKGS